MNENKDETKDRNELINTAVKFLINPNIQKASVDAKRFFLKKKGLTEDEIQTAFSRASTMSSQPPQISHTAIQIPPHYQVASQMSWWWKVREILHSIALISGLAYTIYWFYKQYIYPYLFGKPKDKSTLESLEKIEKSLNQNVADVKSQISQVQQKLNTLENAHEKNATFKQLHDLKTEITTVKGLLLNRKQFPSANTPSSMISLGQPAIPAWQLSEGENLGKTLQNLASPLKSDQLDETNSNETNDESEKSREVIENASDSILEQNKTQSKVN